MKKIISIIMAVIIMSTFAAAVFEIENETYKFLVTMINQEPDPVAPGNLVDVRFRIENRRSEPAHDVEVKIEPKYPFTLYRASEQIQEIGTLAPNQADDTGVRVKYTLAVDENAVEGDNELEFWYRIDGGSWQKAGEYMIEVRSKGAVLAINEIDTGGKRMLPGSTVKVNFNLENMAASTLRDIKLKLELFSTVGTATTELPFTPIGSGNEKTIAVIGSGKNKEVQFDLFIDSEAASKVYKVPYTLSYSDAVGTEFSRSGYVGLMVDAEPDVSINIDETNIYSAGASGSVTIKFVNKGFSDVKFLDVVLEGSDDYEILSNPEVYIGNVDSDDYESADYDLLIKEGVEGDVELPLQIEYRNSNGKLYSQDLPLSLKIYSGDSLKQRMNNGGNSAVGVIIVVVIVALGIIIWRWRKKKKQNK